MFLAESRQTMFYTHVLKVYINYAKKTFEKITNLTDTILLALSHFVLYQ